MTIGQWITFAFAVYMTVTTLVAAWLALQYVVMGRQDRKRREARRERARIERQNGGSPW